MRNVARNFYLLGRSWKQNKKVLDDLRSQMIDVTGILLNGNPDMPAANIEEILATILGLIENTENEVVIDICISREKEKFIRHLLKCIRSNDGDVHRMALKCLGEVLACDDERIGNQFHQENGLDALYHLLTENVNLTVDQTKEALWCVSNIAAGFQAQIN